MEALEEAPTEIEAGPSSFANGSFKTIIRANEALDQAVGTDTSRLRSLAANVATDLNSIVSRNEDLVSRAQASSAAVAQITHEAENSKERLSELTRQIAAEAQTAAKLRSDLEQALNPDARFKSSLESLSRRARERVSEIDSAKAESVTVVDTIKANLSASDLTLQAAEDDLSSLRELKTEAEGVLQLSSQAGLAASYKQEAKRLGWRALTFTILLYAASALTIWFAVNQVIPGMADAVAKIGPTFSATEALSVDFLRLLLISPLAYVIYFTSGRVHDLELLRMDYSEKSAASLAYSGYSQQMNADPQLLNQLKASLLMKFSEHPERLLGRGRATSKASIKVPGYEAATEFSRDGERRKPSDEGALEK